MSGIWKTQRWPQVWERSVFIPVLKKGSAKECSNCWTVGLTSHASKVMFEILQARFQQYMNWEFSDIQARLRKSRGTRSVCNQIANISWIIEKARGFQKNTHVCFIDYTKAFDCADHTHKRSHEKLLKRWEYQIILPVSWGPICGLRSNS